MFGWFKQTADETVETIISEFRDIEERLVTLADKKFKEQHEHLAAMAQAEINAYTAKVEADRATTVANKIRALVA